MLTLSDLQKINYVKIDFINFQNSNIQRRRKKEIQIHIEHSAQEEKRNTNSQFIYVSHIAFIENLVMNEEVNDIYTNEFLPMNINDIEAKVTKFVRN